MQSLGMFDLPTLPPHGILLWYWGEPPPPLIHHHILKLLFLPTICSPTCWRGLQVSSLRQHL